MPSNFQAAVTHKPDAVHLHAYAGLTYAPQQHGDFIAFARNGKPVQEMADAEPAKAASVYLDNLAASLGVSFGDACDAMKYLRDTKAI